MNGHARNARFAALLLLTLLSALSAGCGTSLSAPPLEIAVRDSLIGAGKVIQIKNGSNEPLEQIRVRIRAPSGEEREYVEGRLDGYGVLEVGWKKLGGWEVPAGATVQVNSKGHLLAVKGRVAEE